MDMLIEAEAIPYDPAPLRGERLLLLAPHPDDEVIGCGGLLALHLRENRAVRVVVATDGAKATGAEADLAAYCRRREEESRAGLAMLGGSAEVEFLRFPDRGLDERVAPRLREQLLTFRPDLICVPSPIEIHPDHLALSRAFCDLIQQDRSLYADLAAARVAFYEVSQPLRPNALVDISSVADIKYAAIAAHHSQLTFKDYIAYARGLNAYRAMTLPDSKSAEAYWVAPLPLLRTTSFSELRKAVGHPQPIESVREAVPVAVIVRTKDRPALLREAIDSIRANGYPAEIIVVNDGGTRPEIEKDVHLIEHKTSRGRSEAMNSGVREAKSKFVAFLDDDDLFYPEHLPTLFNAATTAPAQAWYSDAVSAFVRLGANGTYETTKRLRLFSEDFDPELLLIDNYIPLTTLLVERAAFLDAGGFDPQFDLFEDWDFLIRLSERGNFVHVPRITCEVRHVEGAGSITLSAPQGSKRFRDAKLQVWKKHRARIDNDLLANVFERRKERAQGLTSQLVEEMGRRNLLENDSTRLERDKNQLISQIQALHDSVNEKLMYIRQLEGGLAEMRGYQAEAQEATAAVDAASKENQELQRAAIDASRALGETQTALRAAQSESDRLQGLLNMIFKSRTWKLHTLVTKMRGRA